MEYLDIVNENNELINVIKTRQYIHENSLWHRHVSCWIINEKGEVLLQKRSLQKKNNPGMWSKTGGHVIAGEYPIDAIKREIKEELGIEIDNRNIKLIDIYKSDNKENKYFGYNFIVKVNYTIEEFVLQIEEVSEVKYVTIEKMIKIKKENAKNYSFNKWKENDFYKQIEIIKQYSI